MQRRECFSFCVHKILEVESNVPVACKLGVILNDEVQFARDIRGNLILIKRWKEEKKYILISLFIFHNIGIPKISHTLDKNPAADSSGKFPFSQQNIWCEGSTSSRWSAK